MFHQAGEYRRVLRNAQTLCLWIQHHENIFKHWTFVRGLNADLTQILHVQANTVAELVFCRDGFPIKHKGCVTQMQVRPGRFAGKPFSPLGSHSVT